jgi:hypothetical protein
VQAHVRSVTLLHELPQGELGGLSHPGIAVRPLEIRKRVLESCPLGTSQPDCGGLSDLAVWIED